MTKLLGLFGRAHHSSPQSSSAAQDSSATEAHDSSFSGLAARLGDDHEALRNLLMDAERKIGEIDGIRQAFGKIVAPVSKTIRALEEEKALAFTLAQSLAESRAAHQALQTEALQLKQKITLLEADKEQMNGSLDRLRDAAGHLESEWAELRGQVGAQTAQINELQQQLERAAEEAALLREQSGAQSAELQSAYSRLAAVEADRAALAGQLALVEDERRALHVSLQQQVTEASHLSRRLAETEAILHGAHTRIAEAETTLVATSDEAGKLRGVLHDAQERHRTEANLLNTRLDAVQSRADIAERLLAEARQNVSALTEEVRAHERKAAQAVAAAQAAEKSQGQMRALRETHERQIRDLEQSRNGLDDRLGATAMTLTNREAELAQAQGRIDFLVERTSELEAQLHAERSTLQRRLDQLSADLQRERMQKAVLDASLESARKERGRLQDEMATKSAASDGTAETVVRTPVPDAVMATPLRDDLPRRKVKRPNGAVHITAA